MVVLVVTLQNRLCQTRRPVALTVEIAGWLFCLTALCYGLLSPYLTIPVMKVFSLLIFCFKIGSAVYLLGAALRAVRQQVPQAAPLFSPPPSMQRFPGQTAAGQQPLSRWSPAGSVSGAALP